MLLDEFFYFYFFFEFFSFHFQPVVDFDIFGLNLLSPFIIFPSCHFFYCFLYFLWYIFNYECKKISQIQFRSQIICTLFFRLYIYF